ncbi:MAG: helix-turn-helix transcriptional regulator [Oscillibacter sp.]|nr:helix-turn-helix transcriptional regulator [Oscillibacter sp.]
MRIDRVKLVTALARADMTIKQLSELSGVGRATISAAKSGKQIRPDTVAKITAILGEEILEKANPIKRKES